MAKVAKTPKNNGKSSAGPDTAIKVAIIVLIGTVITAICSSPIILVLIQKASPPTDSPSSTPTNSAPTSNPSLTAIQATPTYPAQCQRLFGPSSGILYSAKNGFIEISSANMNIHDFILEVRFYNPYDISEGIWDYGLFFHDNGADGYFFSLDARSNWEIDSLLKNKHIDIVDRGKVINMNVSSGEFNDIRLTVIDQTASVYVNDEFVSRIELPYDFGNGNISVGIEFNSNHEVDNKEVRFDGFTIWAVQ